MYSQNELKVFFENQKLPFLQYTSEMQARQYVLPVKKTIKYLRKDSNVLDWGCGNGHWSYFLTENGYKTSGYSFEDCPDVLKSQTLFTHVRANGKEVVALPFESNSFDAVFSIGVLEHVHETGGDQCASMHEVQRILRPNGFFFCFHFPNKYSLIEFCCNASKSFGFFRNKYTHTKKFTQHDIQSLCSNSMLKLVDFGGYDFLPRNIATKFFMNCSSKRVKIFDKIDSLLERTFPFCCTQRFFIAQKL